MGVVTAPSNPHTGDWSGVVKQPDHHCGDDLVLKIHTHKPQKDTKRHKSSWDVKNKMLRALNFIVLVTL